jgi:transposase InsO family protein
MIVEFINSYSKKYSVKTICKALGIARSSYYYIKNPKSNSRLKRRESLKNKILFIYFKNKGIYGAPKIHQELLKEGCYCSLKLVQKIMKELDIKSIIVKKYKARSNSSVKNAGANLLNRDFKSEYSGLKIVGDITYIYTQKDGWCYLSSFMDLYSRKIIGWSYGKSMNKELVLESLDKAASNISIDYGKSILHTDLGSQYTSNEYRNRAKELGFVLSYSGKGNPYDNACIESFHSILKKECVYRNNFVDFESSKLIIFEFIESWYNRRRIHSHIGYLTPEEFENNIA